MTHSLEFVSIGQQAIDGVPLRCVPLAEPHAAALYRRRLEAVRSSEAEYICFVDGGADVCLPGFVEAMQTLADSGAALGYAAELVHGQPRPTQPFTLANYLRDFSMIHHGVVCRVADLKEMDWPAGLYSFEVLAYGRLAQLGHVYDPVPRYDWRPGRCGARLWPTYAPAIIYSLRALQGLGGNAHTIGAL